MAVWRGVTRLGSMYVSCDCQTVCVCVCLCVGGMVSSMKSSWKFIMKSLCCQKLFWKLQAFVAHGVKLSIWSQILFFQVSEETTLFEWSVYRIQVVFDVLPPVIFPLPSPFQIARSFFPKARLCSSESFSVDSLPESEWKGQEKISAKNRCPLSESLSEASVLPSRNKLQAYRGGEDKIYSCFLPRYKVKLYISLFPLQLVSSWEEVLVDRIWAK